MFFLKVSIQCLVLYVAAACLAAGEAGASLLKGALIGDAQPAVIRGGLKRDRSFNPGSLGKTQDPEARDEKE